MATLGNAKLTFNYFDAEVIDNIRRNVETLFSVREGTIPLDRSFGISHEFVGYPMPVAQNLFALEAYEKMEKYVPEAEIIDISYKFNATEGIMYPYIIIGPRTDDDEEYDDYIDEMMDDDEEAAQEEEDDSI